MDQSLQKKDSNTSKYEYDIKQCSNFEKKRAEESYQFQTNIKNDMVFSQNDGIKNTYQKLNPDFNKEVSKREHVEYNFRLLDEKDIDEENIIRSMLNNCFVDEEIVNNFDSLIREKDIIYNLTKKKVNKFKTFNQGCRNYNKSHDCETIKQFFRDVLNRM